MPRPTTNQWNANILFHFHTDNTARRHVLLCLIAFCSSFVRVVSFRIKCAAVPSFTLSTVRAYLPEQWETKGLAVMMIDEEGGARSWQYLQGRTQHFIIILCYNLLLFHPSDYDNDDDWRERTFSIYGYFRLDGGKGVQEN